MAHLLEQMAYIGDVPWHGLGNQLSANEPIEVWAQQAGMDWTICESPVSFMTKDAASPGTVATFPENKVLFRSDTKAPLSVVSQRFQDPVRRQAICEDAPSSSSNFFSIHTFSPSSKNAWLPATYL